MDKKEKSEKIKENSNKLKKFLKINKIIEFFEKINPYKENIIEADTGLVLEKKSTLYYRQFVQWAIDIHLNGFFLNFILAIWINQPTNYLFLLGDGITIWFVFKTLDRIWSTYFWGKIGDKR